MGEQRMTLMEIGIDEEWRNKRIRISRTKRCTSFGH